MSHYKVEFVEVRKKKGKEFLHVKILDQMIGFFDEEDLSAGVKEGDIISCNIIQKGKFLNGSNLKIIDGDTKDVSIEIELKIDQIIDQKGERPIYDSQSKLHAGPRIYHFEVKDTSKGDKFLVITEQSGKKKNRIFIFDDHAKNFADKFSFFLEKIKKN
ncbi:MAG: DUF3276 family protein [Promethearchaeota archaeon]|nr:MAG: DUF3276 family protein [Candidatus Lokiarchaeota archaeon]